MPKLEILTGNHAKRSFALDQEKARIGSDERCEIWLKEPGISRFHAEILQDEDGRFWIYDQGSSFGTVLNGRDVEEEQLFEGDILILGRVKMQFLEEGETRQPRSSSQEKLRPQRLSLSIASTSPEAAPPSVSFSSSYHIEIGPIPDAAQTIEIPHPLELSNPMIPDFTKKKTGPIQPTIPFHVFSQDDENLEDQHTQKLVSVGSSFPLADGLIPSKKTAASALPPPPLAEKTAPSALPPPPLAEKTAPSALPPPPFAEKTAPSALPPPPFAEKTAPSALPPPPLAEKTAPSASPKEPGTDFLPSGIALGSLLSLPTSGGFSDEDLFPKEFWEVKEEPSKKGEKKETALLQEKAAQEKGGPEEEGRSNENKKSLEEGGLLSLLEGTASAGELDVFSIEGPDIAEEPTAASFARREAPQTKEGAIQEDAIFQEGFFETTVVEDIDAVWKEEQARLGFSSGSERTPYGTEGHMGEKWEEGPRQREDVRDARGASEAERKKADVTKAEATKAGAARVEERPKETKREREEAGEDEQEDMLLRGTSTFTVPVISSTDPLADVVASLTDRPHGRHELSFTKTGMFNAEAGRLRRRLEEREEEIMLLQGRLKQQGQMHQDVLKETIKIYQEDNQRLLIQIEAYEEAARENEALAREMERLAEMNRRLEAENRVLLKENQEMIEILQKNNLWKSRKARGQMP